MDLINERILVTGGAGFVGSHLAERLVRDNEVVVVDDLSTGNQGAISPDVDLVKGDLTDESVLSDVVTHDLDGVFHLAASKAVNTDRPRHQFETNLSVTYNILEQMEAVGVSDLAFTSSSTVYGEAPRPTPEDYAPLEPISAYGAAKLAEESLLSTYAHTYGFSAWNFRFANIVGPGLRGAVVPDFIEKLNENGERLRILGDGRQEKSYMHVDECIDAMLYVIRNVDSALTTINLGTETTTSVTRIADIVSDSLGLDPEYEYTGGDRGWDGDVPRMRLSIEKIRALGWEPTLTSDESVRRAVDDIIGELWADC